MKKTKSYVSLHILSSFIALQIIGVSVEKAVAHPTVNVPINHIVYNFVERFEATGLLSNMVHGIRPYSRKHVADLLTEIRNRLNTGKAGMSAVDLSYLKRFESEFAVELGLKESKNGLDRIRIGQSLYRYEAEEGTFFIDFLAQSKADFFDGTKVDINDQIFRNSSGAKIKGELGDAVGFRASFLQTREQGSRNYTWRHQVYQRPLEIPQLKGDVADFHEATGYAVFSFSGVDFQFGKDEAMWGPGPQDNLGLSHNAPTFTMLRMRSKIGKLNFVSLTGALRPCPARRDSPICGDIASKESYVVNGQSRILERQKYLSGHRIEISLMSWLDLGFHELVIYGDRSVEPTYLNPFMFYWAAQSHLGDKDNVIMGVDVDIRPIKNTRIYASYFIDDLKKAKIFSNDYANKFSIHVGAQMVNPPGLKDGDLNLEYVRIEPWIYTHKFPINTHRHFDSPLGYNLPPNSEKYGAVLRRRLPSFITIEFGLERIRHGANSIDEHGITRNVGGSLHYGWRPGDERESKEWLSGERQKWTALTLGVNWSPWPNSMIGSGYRKVWTERSTINLPSDFDLNMDNSYLKSLRSGWYIDARWGVF